MSRFDGRYCGAPSGLPECEIPMGGAQGRITCTEPPDHGPVRDPDGQAWAHAAAESRCWWGVLQPAEPTPGVGELERQLREVADQCADVVLGAFERHRLTVEQYDHNRDPFGINLPEHPLRQRDRTGRPLLADVLAGRAQALAALMHLALEQRR